MALAGIAASHMCMNKKGDSEPVAYLFMRGKSMHEQLSGLADLMEEIALTTDFEPGTMEKSITFGGFFDEVEVSVGGVRRNRPVQMSKRKPD